ncbi:MAG TPA: hypothetical protein VGY98_00770 [Verrucomicrobiae bacterium]|nr:hypothetical protein [Verrucomicrobiae bacterium]
MKPTIKARVQNTYHRDGTVSYFNVFNQSWERKAATGISHNVLASFKPEERLRVQSLATGHTVAELREIRADAHANDALDRREYAAMSQAERDAHNNL